MAVVSLSPSLRAEYRELFDTCEIRPERASEVARITDKLCAGKHADYLWFESFGFPWYFVALLHQMESGMDFSRHLHNGDPLTARTIHVPIGRPVEGEPPFVWQDSALDALQIRRPDGWKDWTVAGLLYRLETWNGFGYRLYHRIFSPYLWSFSRHYRSGKYSADGVWDADLISKQCGAAVILRRLVNLGEIALPHFETEEA